MKNILVILSLVTVATLIRGSFIFLMTTDTLLYKSSTQSFLVREPMIMIKH